MKAFITGATGFIGTNLTKRLLDEGWQVRALVRDRSRFRLSNHKNLQILEGDLTNQISLDKGTQGTDIVFNLAGGLPYHNLSEDEYIRANIEGVKSILKASGAAKVKRLIHVSTVGIYGPSQDGIIDEKSKINALGIYPDTKLKGERLVSSYGLPFVIIRPTIAYGPYDTRPGFLDLFKFIKKRLFFLVGDGSNFFHTIYVENLVDALILASYTKEALNEDFIIGDEECPTMKKLVQTIAQAEGIPLNPFYIPKPLAFLLAKIPGIPLNSRRVVFITENRRYSIEKAKKVLGYKPRFDLEMGIKRTYNWYIENGYIK